MLLLNNKILRNYFKNGTEQKKKKCINAKQKNAKQKNAKKKNEIHLMGTIYKINVIYNGIIFG